MHNFVEHNKKGVILFASYHNYTGLASDFHWFIALLPHFHIYYSIPLSINLNLTQKGGGHDMSKPHQDKPILRLDHVNFSYYSNLGEVKVLNDINFTVEKGAFAALVGPSGCGKSTILSLIAGLLKPVSGFITYYSDDFNAPRVGYMLQHDHLLEWRSVYQNITLGLEIQKKKNKENLELVDELLDKYHLSNVRKQKPSALSGGMRQRIALIRTLALRPDLLLLDEPFSALDYQTRLNVSKDVHDIIKSEQKTAILVTHDISEAISMADVIFVLTKPPCTIKDVLPIEFEANGVLREDMRKSSLFQEYFDQIWREMQDENTEK